MFSRRKNKTVSLFETRIASSYIVMTAICYFAAAVIWYMLAVVLPFTDSRTVDAQTNARLTREAFSASEVDDTSSERVTLMPTGMDSFLKRLKLIEDAQKSIDYMVYDNYSDDGPAYFYSAIMRAADRGVKVRLFFDGKMGKLGGIYAPLQDVLQSHDNIEMYLFNGWNFGDPASLMVFAHDKVTVVDGDKMIVGGVNMGLGAYVANYDMEVLVTNGKPNGSILQASKYFEYMINHALTDRKTSKKCDFSIKKEITDKYSAFMSQHEEVFLQSVDYASLGIPANKIMFLSNPVNNEKKSPVIFQAALNLAASSRRTRIVTPYALLTDAKEKKLKAIARQSEEFILITNSLYNTRNMGYAEYINHRTDYIDENIALYEFQADNQLHAKMMTFDGRFSMIGSFNLDERSCHLDTESVIIIDSEPFTALVDKYIDDVFLADSLRVGGDNKYIPSDSVEEGIVPVSKRVMYKLLNIESLLINLL